ncbi:MAG: hypothetical protein GY822_12035, partial [Deltaproteobacteria bacterium]|nr:hypothetical protein [Deltaproteobacteria bacterium]
WQATIALIFAKLYREIVKYTGIVGAIGLGLVGVGMIAPTLLAGFAPGMVPAIPAYYLPVALAGLVTFGGYRSYFTPRWHFDFAHVAVSTTFDGTCIRPFLYRRFSGGSR